MINKEDKFYIGSALFDFENGRDKLQQRIKNLLLLNNTNFLFGNGASLSLGAPLISNVKSSVKIIDEKTTADISELKGQWKKIKSINNFNEGIAALKAITEEDEFKLDIESFLNALIQSHSTASLKSFESETISLGGKNYNKDNIEAAIFILKSYLFYSCKIFLDKIPGTTNKLRAHKEFLRRSSRSKIFTTNYDLIYEFGGDKTLIIHTDKSAEVSKKDLDAAERRHAMLTIKNAR